jgi:hypothetical protein
MSHLGVGLLYSHVHHRGFNEHPLSEPAIGNLRARDKLQSLASSISIVGDANTLDLLKSLR